MKKLMKKILAGMLALAMVIANLAGVGITEAKAAEPGVFQVKVIVENAKDGDDLSGIPLQLFHAHAGTLEFSTDAEGMATYTFDEEDWGYVVQAPFYQLRVDPNSEYTCECMIWVECDEDGDVYTYNDEKGSKAENYIAPIEIIVKRMGEEPTTPLDNKVLKLNVVDGENQPVPNVAINLTDSTGTNVLYTSTSDSAGIWTLDLTAHPIEEIDCRLRVAVDSGYKGNAMKVKLDFTGSGDEKQVFVEKIDDKNYTEYSETNLPCFQIEKNTDPAISNVTVTQNVISEKTDTSITVTVQGKYLPEKLYYKRYYVKDGNDIVINNSELDGVEIDVLGETDTEKTFNVSLPASIESESPYSTATAWKIAVATPKIGDTVQDFVKSSEIRIRRDEVEPDLKEKLETLVSESENYQEDLYTPTSWSGYNMALKTGRELLEKGEDITNTECKAAIEKIEEAKGKLIEKNAVFEILAVDEDNNPVENVKFEIASSDSKWLFDAPTSESGYASYTMIGNEDENVSYVVQPTEDSGYICDTADLITLTFVNTADRHYIKTVNGVEYSSDTSRRTIKLKKVQQVLPGEISKVTGPSEPVSRDGQTVAFTVQGTNLTEDVYYIIWRKMENGTEAVVDGPKLAQAAGDGTSRTFNVALPAVSEYPGILKWNIQVATEENPQEGWISADIDIAADVVADVVKEETKAALETAIAEMEQTVQADYSADSWKAYTDAVNAAKDLLKKEGATDTEYQNAINAINEAKKALVSVKALNEAVTESTKLKKTDYTSATWSAYSRAVEAGKALLSRTSAVTDAECANAVKAINDAKKALKKAVQKVTITTSSVYKKIALGKKLQLTAKVTPADAANKSVKWTSSNKKIATVNQKGKVTVTKSKKYAGKTVKITATATDGSNKKAVYTLKVVKDSVKKISLKAKKTVKAGKKVTVKATVKTTGKNANKKLVWSVSNKKYASVNAKGVVTTKKAGKGKSVTITAKATDGSNKKASVKIKIKK